MPTAVKGMLIECDPSIKAIIVKIDSENHHRYIVEDLDDTTVVIKESALTELKMELEKALADTQQIEEEESGDD